ncbi:hypothetical protein BOSE21B_110517 [Bosea sp. 21B]|nr:hypothetical protein BOSE21B_110517 [Bosea sp. 21B]
MPACRKPIWGARSDGAAIPPQRQRFLRQGGGRPRRLAGRRGGPDRLGDRAERSRQDDDDAGDHGASAVGWGGDLRGLQPHRARRRGARRAWHLSRAGKARAVRRHVRRRQSDPRFVQPEGPLRRRCGPAASLSALPAAAGAPASKGRHAVGRRAPDAGAGPRPDGQAEAAHPRRAEPGSGAAHRARDLQDDLLPARARRLGVAGRTECPRRTRDRRLRLCAGDRRDRPAGQGRYLDPRSKAHRRLSWGRRGALKPLRRLANALLECATAFMADKNPSFVGEGESFADSIARGGWHFRPGNQPAAFPGISG